MVCEEQFTWLHEQTIVKPVLTYLTEFSKKHGILTTIFSVSVVWGLQGSLGDLTLKLMITPSCNEQQRQELTQWLTNLGLLDLKNTTTIKPSGSLSKVMDTTEGVHKPLGKYIFNNVNFGKFDPLVPLCRAAGYKVIENPSDPEAVLITFPVVWGDVPFEKVERDGKVLEVNLESAIDQLERYKMLMVSWCQQNVSATISYSVEEVPGIVDWLLENWDNYVGVSFLFRADPTKTAKDLGYLYLPQEVVTKEVYDEYSARIQPIELDKSNDIDAEIEDDCASGACPIR